MVIGTAETNSLDNTDGSDWLFRAGRFNPDWVSG